MITPIRALTIQQICERKNDLLMSDDDIKELARNVRNKAIENFSERLKPIIDEKIKGWTNSDDLRRWCERSIDEIAEQMKEGAE